MSVDLFSGLKNTFTISGRARRREYVGFVILSFIIVTIMTFMSFFSFLGFLAAFSELGLLSWVGLVLFGFAGVGVMLFISKITLSIRRLHDLNKSGWFCLFLPVPIVGIFFFFYLLLKDGTLGDNRYGPSPKAL
jgi:uncharacterized membrane protein YhaH (DUF805 family)